MNKQLRTMVIDLIFCWFGGVIIGIIFLVFGFNLSQASLATLISIFGFKIILPLDRLENDR